MKDNIQAQLELLEMMKQGFGKVRTEEEIQDDLDREFQERLRKESQQREQERLYKEQLEKEREEIREQQYQAHKEIFDFMKVFNELPVDDYYCVVELKNGKQFMGKPGELKRDSDYIMFYIQRNVVRNSMFDCPFETILEVNVNEIKGLKLQEEIRQEVVIIKKSVYGKMQS